MTDYRNIDKSFQFAEGENVIYFRYRDCGSVRREHVFVPGILFIN